LLKRAIFEVVDSALTEECCVRISPKKLFASCENEEPDEGCTC
jgi:hypothetical protein